ncbi:MAG: hypothetical protein HZB65_04040, partial [Candidatus Aenigmarchaeota archaeon]|nr:hypothetical protein [Candidatus Aenigmarchaeota archaeon]
MRINQPIQKQGIRIVIVDDDKDIVYIANRYFGKNGYDTISFIVIPQKNKDCFVGDSTCRSIASACTGEASLHHVSAKEQSSFEIFE